MLRGDLGRALEWLPTWPPADAMSGKRVDFAKLNPPKAFAKLERLLADQVAYAAVMPIDWARFLAQLPPHADRDFFSAVARSPARTHDVGAIEAGRDR